MRSHRLNPPQQARAGRLADLPSRRPAVDGLTCLHVRIAKRADELARRFSGPHTHESDVQCWLRAEREVLGS